MSWRALPPAGNPVVLDVKSGQLPNFSGYTACWLDSGTSALALALRVARARRPDVAKPEVILPAYGCPDLVAAAEFAGVQPVLVDIGAADPAFDPEALRVAIGERTIAVVAINFLGIAERLEALRAELASWPQVTLIEDDAQWYPENVTHGAARGDAICLSFGRGKPVSLLGGGALLLTEPLASLLANQPVEPAGVAPSRSKLAIYNLMLHPGAYGLLTRLPFLGLGRTAFDPLERISHMDSGRLGLLGANVSANMQRDRLIERRIGELLPEALDLPRHCNSRAGRLLRYPVICADRAQRDELWRRLQDAGLGATAMYQRVLAEIDGVGARVRISGSSEGAHRFADRLLTLPTHAGVDPRSLERMARIFKGA